MVTAKDLVDSSDRDGLVEQAKDLGLSDKGEGGKPLNKTELAEAILAAEAAEIEADESEDVDSVDDVEEVEDEVAEVEPEAELDSDIDENEDVLVRFIGKNLLLQVAGVAFKKDSPFKVLKADKAEELFASNHGHKFRVATPKEAKEFYS